MLSICDFLQLIFVPFSHIFRTLQNGYLQLFANGGPFSDLRVVAGIGTISFTCIGHTFVLTSKYITTDLLMPVLGILFCAYID